MGSGRGDGFWGAAGRRDGRPGPAADALSDAELSQHLTVVRTQIANPAIDLVRREGLAQDMAATLDRAAQAAADPEVRRQRWGEAIDLIDDSPRRTRTCR